MARKFLHKTPLKNEVQQGDNELHLMKHCQVSKEESLVLLSSSLQGLTPAEAELRLTKYGENSLVSNDVVPL